MTKTILNSDEFEEFFYEKEREEFDIDGSQIHETKISNLHITEDVTFNNFSFDRKTIFENCIFENDLNLIGLEVNYIIKFDNCQINNKIYIFNSEFKSTLCFCDISTKDLEIQTSIFNFGIIFKNITCNGIIYFKNISVFKIPISFNENDNINRVEFNFGPESTGDFNIKNTSINTLILKGINNKSSILISDCNIEKIALVRFYNYNLLELINIKCTSNLSAKFYIKKSQLNKTVFQDINFNNYETTIIDSNFSEIIATNIIWPKKIYCAKESNSNPKKLKEIYQQFKQVTLKQGDIFSSLVFKSLEMNAHYKSTSWKNNFSDKFIILTNRYSNYHGLNWLRCLGWIMSTNLIYFTLIYGFGKNMPISLEVNDIFKTISDYIKFINPIHDNNKELDGFYIFIDTVSRILNSYFIFQFLRAFRKFTI
ncbi:MAG: hypothetical protein U0V72_13265 [Cytophagales bacterium]